MGDILSHYRELLGVTQAATIEEIKTAYRALAKKHHPDKTSTPGADERFRELTEACNTLCGLSEKESATAESPTTERRGTNSTVTLQATLFDLISCASKPVSYVRWNRCVVCDGTGSAARKTTRCAMCGGSGYQGMSVLLGNKKHCLYCDGVGFTPHPPKCPSCNGKGVGRDRGMIRIQLNPYSEVIVVQGKGNYPVGGGTPGNLIVEVHIEAHPKWELQGIDLHTSIDISPAQAVVGDDIELNVLGKVIPVFIPAGIQQGATIFKEGAGVKYEGKEGCLKCKVNIIVPRVISKDEEHLYRQIIQMEKETEKWPRVLSL